MARNKCTPFRVVAAYDTETCNIGNGPDTRAYPILYILNDFADVPLEDYRPDHPNERVTFDRTPREFVNRLNGIIRRGLREDYIPIVCVYNMTFDMMSLMEKFAKSRLVKVNAQSSTNIYTMDVYWDAAAVKAHRPLIRFWDTFFLERGGLSVMGDVCGIEKAVGDWDYSLIRTPQTPLTDLELFYAKRDVQVIPAYLRYLMLANDWLTPDMFGSRVLTKTSLVRQFARIKFGGVRLSKRKDGKGYNTMLTSFEQLCHREMPMNYAQYALRKACFRGGFTFTAAATACQDVHGVISTDVTSMHHTFINGRFVPIGFTPCSREALAEYARTVMETSREEVLARYWQPFDCAFHGRFIFENLRLKKGTCFNKWGVALIPRGKFAPIALGVDYWDDDPAAVAAEQGIRDRGWHDQVEGAEFAFGKLYRADKVMLHLNEIELWCISRVYEWDGMRSVFGEATITFKRPPDYITLQSNALYKRKDECKHVVSVYGDGDKPYPAGEVPASIPGPLAEMLYKGEMAPDFLNNYYNGTVKGQFNSVYGTQAQDVFKPGYDVWEDGSVHVADDLVLTPDNFNKRKPKRCRVLYTYGMRIVAGSRMHLVIAMELLWERFGGRVFATGGDTDSIKCHVPDEIDTAEVERALDPILDASTKAIATACAHIREAYPEWASDMHHVGGFEVEHGGVRYTHHMEFWNKARVSYVGGKYSVTMAGLSRPVGAYHIEKIMTDLERGGYEPAEVMRTALGYNVVVASSASFALMSHRPKPGEMFDADVTDYLGNTCHVHAPQVIALYDTDRVLGDVDKPSNRENVDFLKRHYGVEVDTGLRELSVTEDQVPAVTRGFAMDEVIMQGVKHVKKP